MLYPLGHIQIAPTVATGLYLTGAIAQDLDTGSVEDASNADPIVITSTAHGLSNGNLVIITGVGGNTAANGTFIIANKADDTFELTTDGSTGVAGNGAYTTGGTWRHVANNAITNATNATPIVITARGHGLSNGDVVIISGVAGNTAANGVFVVKSATTDTFALSTNGTDSVAGSGAYTTGGTWRHLPATADMVILTAEAQHVRWRDDGTDPDGSTGMLIKTTDPPFVYRGDLQAIKFYEDASGGKVNVAFYKEF